MPGALGGGDRVHPAELEDVAVRVGELPLVHEAVVRGGVRFRAACGDAVGERLVHRLPRVDEDGGRHRWVHSGVADRQVGEALEVLAHQDHEVAVVLLDDDAGRVVIREERVDGESDRRVERLGTLQVSHRQIDEHRGHRGSSRGSGMWTLLTLAKTSGTSRPTTELSFDDGCACLPQSGSRCWAPSDRSNSRGRRIPDSQLHPPTPGSFRAWS